MARGSTNWACFWADFRDTGIILELDLISSWFQSDVGQSDESLLKLMEQYHSILDPPPLSHTSLTTHLISLAFFSSWDHSYPRRFLFYNKYFDILHISVFLLYLLLSKAVRSTRSTLFDPISQTRLLSFSRRLCEMVKRGENETRTNQQTWATCLFAVSSPSDPGRHTRERRRRLLLDVSAHGREHMVQAAAVWRGRWEHRVGAVRSRLGYRTRQWEHIHSQLLVSDAHNLLEQCQLEFNNKKKKRTVCRGNVVQSLPFTYFVSHVLWMLSLNMDRNNSMDCELLVSIVWVCSSL